MLLNFPDIKVYTLDKGIAQAHRIGSVPELIYLSISTTHASPTLSVCEGIYSFSHTWRKRHGRGTQI